MQQKAGQASWIMGDGHVHIHNSFDTGKLFKAALNNFSRYTQDLGLTGNINYFLLLTESAGTEAFVQLQDSPNSVTGFTIQPTDDANCLRMDSDRGTTLFVVAGRQIVTAEALEVLALGLDTRYPDGRPMQEILRDLQEKNCLMVLPWGAGKWLGKRGRIIESTVQSFHNRSFFLGDNGNRPFFWPRPAVFARAVTQGTDNLQGSDPLPFADQEERAGSFGFYLPGTVSSNRPFQSLVQRLTGPENSLQAYGKPERALPFFHLQISMQLSKRFNK